MKYTLLFILLCLVSVSYGADVFKRGANYDIVKEDGKFVQTFYPSQVNIPCSEGSTNFCSYDEMTTFKKEDGKLVLEWYDKRVELIPYLKDDTDTVAIDLNQVASIQQSKLGGGTKLGGGMLVPAQPVISEPIDNNGNTNIDLATTDIIPSKNSYYFTDTLSDDALSTASSYGYKINATNTNCEFSDNKLVCDNEQIIDFTQAVEEQNLTVNSSYLTDEDTSTTINTIEIRADKEGTSLELIDPTTTYNFLSPNNGSILWAYTAYNSTAMATPPNLITPLITNFAQFTDYSKITSINAQYMVTLHDDNLQMHYFNLTLPPTINSSDVWNITWLWTGMPNSASTTDSIWAWNYTGSRWDKYVNYFVGFTAVTKTFSLNNPVDYFLGNRSNIIIWQNGTATYTQTDYITVNVSYYSLIVNTPVSNQEVLNNLSLTLNTSQTGYNSTVFYSWNNGIKNLTLCTNSNECQGVVTFPRQGYYNLTVYANKSDGSLTSSTVNNIFIGGTGPTWVINSSQTICGIYNNYSVVQITNSAVATVCAYNGVGTNGTAQFNNLTYFIMDSGSIINGTGRGYRSLGSNSNGEGIGGGNGTGYSNTGGAGGGYGGVGGNGAGYGNNGGEGAGGIMYGSTTNVTNMGSAGGSSSALAGNGGGYFKLNSSYISILGQIIFNGNKGGDGGGLPDSGGGSGGGIWLMTNNLVGTGNIYVIGGNGGTTSFESAGGGSGGRIFIQYLLNNSNYNTNASGGLKGTGSNSPLPTNGGAGTVTYQQNSSLSVLSTNAAPVVTNTISNNSNYNSGNVNLTFNVSDDNDYIANSSIYLDGVLNGTGFYNLWVNTSINTSATWVMTGIADGNHYYYITVCDSDGSCTNGQTLNFSIDSTAPVINILNPGYGDGLISNVSIALNYTVSDATTSVSSCWYKLYNLTTNITGNVSLPSCLNTTFNISAGAGTYNITLFSNDTLGNIGNHTHQFIITLGSPGILLNSPDNLAYLNTSNISLNWTASDGNGISACQIWHNFTGTWSLNTTRTDVVSAVMANQSYNLSDNNYNWNIWCNDTLNNGNFSILNRTFTIDTISPTVTIDSITATVGVAIQFTDTVTDVNIGTCSYSIINSTLDVVGSGSATCNSTTTGPLLGYDTYILSLTAIDLAGNSKTTSSGFTISSTPPTPPGGGGGSTTIVVNNITNEVKKAVENIAICGDSICSAGEDALGITGKTCPQDCPVDIDAFLCFINTPAAQCQAWVFTYVVLMLVVIILGALIFRKRKK